MRQRARRWKRRHGLDLIIVDHLQLIRQGGRVENRRLEIGDATSSLKAVAKELAIPVLLLSQLSRAVEHRDNKRPMLSDLRESGDIEQDADVAMFLFREEYYLERERLQRNARERQDAFEGRLADHQAEIDKVRGLAEIDVAKNRHGRTGMARVAWSGERQRFDNLAKGGIE
jgi:replicative DNA helicase